MTLEIRVMAWDRYTNVAGLYRLKGSHHSPLGNLSSKGNIYGSVYSYNNFQQIVVRIASNLILTTNDITESIQ